jgi:hypothetical protein
MLNRTFVIVGNAQNPSPATRSFIPKGAPPYGLIYRPTIEINANVGTNREKDIRKVADTLRDYFTENGWTNVSVTVKKTIDKTATTHVI